MWPLSFSCPPSCYCIFSERPLFLFRHSAVLLGAGELGLEPLLGGEEAVASEHRD